MGEGDWNEWIGRVETAKDRAAALPARGLAAALELPFQAHEGEELPGLWNWLYFLPVVPMSGLANDGHPKRGGFLPPVPLERRMWAGSRVSFHGAIQIGDAFEKRSEILKIAQKEGKAGPMVFVTVKHAVSTARGLAVAEEQDIVYLPMPKAFAPPPATPLPEGLAWQQLQAIDTVLLFRFSAITFNGHRIHYDRGYARDAEKYPGLVVHGPLQALMLFEAARARDPGKRPARFEFRVIRPLFDFDRVTLSGRSRDGGGLDLFTANGDGAVSTQATIHWSADGENP